MQTSIADHIIREEALDPSRSFIVQAPAGSGKTGLLMQRMLVLLERVKFPEECLAITFTRKAAAEMRERIVKALECAKKLNEAAPTDPYKQKTLCLARRVLARDEKLGWNLLENPNRLKIQTIDALCMSLTRQVPVVSHFGGTPKVIEDASPLYQIAARELLKALETEEPWSDSLRILLAHLDNNVPLTERLMADMLQNRDQWLPYIGRTLSEPKLREILELGLKALFQELENALLAALPEHFEEILELANYAAHQLQSMGQEKADSFIPYCHTLTPHWRGGQSQDLFIWKGLSELLLTKEGNLRRLVTEQQGFKAQSRAGNKSDKAQYQLMKDRMGACLSRLAEYPVFIEHLKWIAGCPPALYADTSWEIVAALVKLLPVLVAELSLVFQKEGQVDFVEISIAALRALGREAPTDLSLGLDYKIQHILVDEFQDTSLSHFRLLELLTAGWQRGDNRTLFLVGDPMQSIYRFRQAEVSLFIRAKTKGLGDVLLHPLTLTVNFRSDPTLVEWTNTTFKKLFPAKDDIVSSAIAFSDSIAIRPKAGSAIAQFQEVTEASEAGEVTRLVETLQEEEPNSSIALLVRSRTHLREILPRLKQAKIDFQGVQLELLKEQTIIQDLLSLTRALLHLGDRIAWLSVLRAPGLGISLNDLWIIANYEPDLPLWETLSVYEKLNNLSETARASLEKIVPVFSNAIAMAGRSSLRTLVMETWIALGGASYLEDINNIQAIETFFAVLEEQEHNFYETEVLEKRLESMYAKQNTLGSGNVNALQIMTIHKAKGLEFDTVIVPGMGKRSYPEPSRLLLWEERVGALNENYLIFTPIKSVGGVPDPIYHYLNKQNQQRATYEALRLWYVAATRARKRLYCLVHDFEQSIFSSEN